VSTCNESLARRQDIVLEKFKASNFRSSTFIGKLLRVLTVTPPLLCFFIFYFLFLASLHFVVVKISVLAWLVGHILPFFLLIPGAIENLLYWSANIFKVPIPISHLKDPYQQVYYHEVVYQLKLRNKRVYLDLQMTRNKKKGKLRKFYWRALICGDEDHS